MYTTADMYAKAGLAQPSFAGTAGMSSLEAAKMQNSSEQLRTALLMNDPRVRAILDKTVGMAKGTEQSTAAMAMSNVLNNAMLSKFTGGSVVDLGIGMQQMLASSRLRFSTSSAGGASTMQTMFGGGIVTDKLAEQLVTEVQKKFMSKGFMGSNAGGMSLTDMGVLQSEMSRRGYFSGMNAGTVEYGKNEKGETTFNTKISKELTDKTVDMIEMMGPAIDNLRKVFGEPTAKLVARLEELTGADISVVKNLEDATKRVNNMIAQANAMGLDPAAFADFQRRSVAAGMTAGLTRGVSGYVTNTSALSMVQAAGGVTDNRNYLAKKNLYTIGMSADTAAGMLNADVGALSNELGDVYYAEYVKMLRPELSGDIDGIMQGLQSGDPTTVNNAKASLTKLMSANNFSRKDLPRLETIKQSLDTDPAAKKRIGDTLLNSLANRGEKQMMSDARRSMRVAGITNSSAEDVTNVLKSLSQATIAYIAGAATAEEKKKIAMNAGLTAEEADRVIGTIGTVGADKLASVGALMDPLKYGSLMETKENKFVTRKATAQKAFDKLFEAPTGDAGFFSALLDTGGGKEFTANEYAKALKDKGGKGLSKLDINDPASLEAFLKTAGITDPKEIASITGLDEAGKQQKIADIAAENKSLGFVATKDGVMYTDNAKNEALRKQLQGELDAYEKEKGYLTEDGKRRALSQDSVYAGKRRAIDELPLTREDAQKARDVAGRAELNKYLADNGLGDALTGSASEVAGKLAADKDFSALIAGMNGNDANKKRLATGVLTGTTGKLALEKYITGLETEQGKLDANDAEKRAEIQKKIDAAKAALGATSDASTTPFIFKFSGDSTQLKGVLEQGGKK